MFWPFGKARRRRRLRAQFGKMIRAKFDAAQTTDENRRHWANADGLSAVAATNPAVRRIVRNRARYEVASNSIARGIVLTLANDLVGAGPQLQMLTIDKELNRAIEQGFGAWSAEIHLAAKLRTMRMARAQDGEAIGVMFNNRGLRGPVKMDVRLVEADRLGESTFSNSSWRPGGILGVEDENKAVDGIVFDEYGNPAQYHILKRHPGAADAILNFGGAEYDVVPAASVVHWFRADRPGQRRGVPDIMPALPLFAILRRYTKATLLAAETAADLSLIMKTTSPAGGEAAEVDPWITMEMERNIAMFAPEGWEPHQMKAEQPSATFPEFRIAIINEIARCLNMPRNIAACDSSGYNYASGRLDHTTYNRSVEVERDDMGAVVLVPLLLAWVREAILISDFLPLSARMLLTKAMPIMAHTWLWRSHEEADPVKNAKAAVLLRKAGLLTDAEYWGGRSLDWERQQEQLQREKQGRVSRGLSGPEKEEGAAEAEADQSEIDELIEKVEELENAA